MGDEPSIRAEVATAFRRINAEYKKLPAAIRDSLDVSWGKADDLLNRDLLDGDRAKAIAAIRTWENKHFDLIEAVNVDHGGARPDPRTAV